MAKGIDISKYQGNVDFAKVKKSGIDFVMLRIGTGYGQKFNLDSMFKKNYNGAKKAGLKVGCYFYSYALTVERARQEANEMLNAMKGLKFEYPIAFDIEDKSQKKLSKELLTDISEAFMSTVEKKGYYTMIYTNPDWLRNRLDNSLLKKYDLWLAQWGVEKPSYACGIWQTSSTGKVNGISGNVDTDVSYKDYASIIVKNGLNGFSKSAVKDNGKPPKTENKPISDDKRDKFLPKRGYYRKGDISKNIGLIAKFMRTNFPAYTSRLALGNYFGNNLYKSIKEFQKRTGLEADGNIGRLTLAKLREYGFKY